MSIINLTIFTATNYFEIGLHLQVCKHRPVKGGRCDRCGESTRFLWVQLLKLKSLCFWALSCFWASAMYAWAVLAVILSVSIVNSSMIQPNSWFFFIPRLNWWNGVSWQQQQKKRKVDPKGQSISTKAPRNADRLGGDGGLLCLRNGLIRPCFWKASRFVCYPRLSSNLKDVFSLIFWLIVV